MASIQQTGLTATVQSVPTANSTPHDILNDSIAKRVDLIYAKTLQGRVQELLRIHHDGFPGSQPVSFEARHLIDLQQEDYFVCEKSDGVRYLMFATQTPKGPATFLLDRNRSWFFIPHLLFPLRGKDNEYHNETLMDGELVLDVDEQKNKTLRFLIFDLMIVNTQSVTQRTFSSRLGMLQQEVIQPFNLSPKKSAPFKVELKKMERSYGLGLVLDQMTRLKHASDGVIFSPVKLPYTPGTCEKLLKWKPAELNTVDFRIAVSWSKEHKPIYTLQVVAQGKNYKPYDQLQLEQETALEWKKSAPDGRIGEFRYDPQWNVTIVEPGYAPTVRKGGWRFVKFRDDKELANDEQIVKKILKSIHDGVTKEQLLAHMEEIRAAWKAREKGIPMPEPVTKLPGSIKINTDHLSKSLTGNPMAATPAIISPTTNPFDTYSEKRTAQQGHRDSTSSIDYMPASRKNSLADSVKEHDLSSDTTTRKYSLDDHLSSAEETEAAEDKASAYKNMQSPQWKPQSIADVRKRSEERIDRLNMIRKQSDESSVKSVQNEIPSDKPNSQESKLHHNGNDHFAVAMDRSEGQAKSNDAAGAVTPQPDMTLRQMVESKMPPKFRGSQGKKRSDPMKSSAERASPPSNASAARNEVPYDHRDVKRSKSDSPSGSNYMAQETHKLSFPQAADESQVTSITPPTQPMTVSPPQRANMSPSQPVNMSPSRPMNMSPSRPVNMSPSQNVSMPPLQMANRSPSQPATISPSQAHPVAMPPTQSAIKSAAQSFNGKHASEADAGFGEYRRRKMSSTKNMGAAQVERTQSPPHDDMVPGKAQKVRKIEEQPTAANAYAAHSSSDNSRGGRYDAMSESPPMQMSSATVRHQQMLEQRASPYTTPSSKSTFAVPVSPYQQYATRNISYNQYEVYDTQRRNSDEKSFVTHDQRHATPYRVTSASAPPSRQPSHDEHIPPNSNKRAQPSSIADLLTTNVEVTPPSSRQSTESPLQAHHERRSSSSSERGNPFDFAKILHSPVQHPSDEDSSTIPPNGRHGIGGGSERSPDETSYSHQYSSHSGNALHFINYRADGNQVQAVPSSMEGPPRQQQQQQPPDSVHMSTSKPYSAHSMSARPNSNHPSPHSTISSPDIRGYPPQHAMTANTSSYSSPVLKSSSAYHSPQTNVMNRGPDNTPGSRHRDHPMPPQYRQATYPSYGYQSPVLQHSNLASPGRSRVDYPTAPPQDRIAGVAPPNDMNRQYRRPYQEPVGKPMKSYHEMQYSLVQKSPVVRPKVSESGTEESNAGSPSAFTSRKNNNSTKSKLDFILN